MDEHDCAVEDHEPEEAADDPYRTRARRLNDRCEPNDGKNVIDI